MIAELGLAALWMAAALAALQLVAGAFGVRADSILVDMARPAAIVQALLVMGSFTALLYVFAVTDLSVALVASNSHSAKPFIYKVTGAWGSHEGSMLLWVTVLAMSGALVARFERRLDARSLAGTLAAQGALALGFYAFLLFSSNPFERLATPVPEGLGLNPLLQDIGLAFHPPTLYLGYVGLSVAFSFAVGALLTGRVDRAFADAMRPWVLGAWVFLTLGISAGSYWAYYELGWGGWWFWDPVENASLMPWLAATALLHSVSVLSSRGGLRTWTIMLAVTAFAMSMLGTFLVRSGILTSVHAFAVDPERGAFILVLMVLYTGAALGLFAWRASAIAEGQRFAVVSREGALVVNNVLLSAILAIVLFGTLYPVATEAFGVRVSVGPPYFNPVSAMFFLPLVLVLLVGPLLRWKRDRLDRIAKPAIAAAVVLGAALVGVAMLGGAGLLPALGIALAVALGVASWMPLKGRRLRYVELSVWGMVLAHFGLAVSLFGAAADSGFSKETLAASAIGDIMAIGPYEVELTSITPVAGPNWTATEATMLARRGGASYELHPQSRSFWQPQQQTSESALLGSWNGQLYAVIGEQADGGRWQVRLWWKPFVTLIWLGSILIALGGVLALVGRMGKRRKRDRARARTARQQAELAAL
ncbi:heme lyase CcmF/NrfE family subunit [Alteriqipengyuania flavescens]|uniref:heme lyase CcmF/NrfE family subunit n=1 Tax=Alteriqipengyuania flavescens TaxID=3053610 RepID=UPI0025B492B0|nr:heme lyase CcmF/NrfE family subunit [Alteriqipengyuania flavescens]WJY18590.1 heme lyase CcmF/NrfE family subunit [Alteriqipengyuania flavescens]WJY24530.1 heme lyase CcmF/NrfE family subunit [Alteriqipengyuania flavescens]